MAAKHETVLVVEDLTEDARGHRSCWVYVYNSTFSVPSSVKDSDKIITFLNENGWEFVTTLRYVTREEHDVREFWFKRVS